MECLVYLPAIANPSISKNLETLPVLYFKKASTGGLLMMLTLDCICQWFVCTLRLLKYLLRTTRKFILPVEKFGQIPPIKLFKIIDEDVHPYNHASKNSPKVP